MALWYSGYPQRKAAEWAIERNTGLVAQVRWGGEFPELRIREVYLFANRDAQRRGQPMLSATDIRAEYALLASGRKVKQVRIGVLLVDVDPAAPELRDLPIFKPAPAGTRSQAADATFIPREVTVQDFALRLHSEDGLFFLVDGIGITADVTDAETIDLRMGSPSTRVVYESGQRPGIALEEVTLEGRGRYAAGEIKWQQAIRGAGLVQTVFEVAGTTTGAAPHLRVDVRECALEGDRVAAVLESIGAPVRFAALRLESASGTFGLDESTASSLQVSARIHAPGLPGAAEPLYGEALGIVLTAEHADRLDAQATLAFAQGQTVRAELRGTAEAGEATAAIAGWSRADLLDALPEAFRAGVESLGFDAFATDASVRWTPEGYSVDARAESKGGGAGAAPIQWAIQAAGTRDGSQGIEGTAEARIGERRVSASARYESADHYIAQATIDEVQIAPWVQLFAGEDAAAQIGGTIQGVVHAEARGQDAPLVIQPEITLKAFEYDTLVLDEITLRGALEYSQPEGRVAIDEFRAEAPDGMTAIALNHWEYDTETGVGGGGITGGADLGIVGRLIGQPDLYGGATVEGTVRIVGDRRELDFTLLSDFIGMADLALPYGTKLTGEGNIEYNADADTVILRGVSARAGEGTMLRLGESRFTLSPLAGGGTLTLNSDMQIAIGMAWLQEAQGGFDLEAAYTLSEDVIRADWTARMAADTLVLPDNGGFAEGVTFAAAGTYADAALAGGGDIRATILSAAGGSITGVAGPVLFDGARMRIQGAKGDIFRGQVRADVDIGVLQEGMPIVLDGSFEGVDLAIFSDEVKPPKTQLTGTAQGRVTAEYGADGLAAFRFEAESPGQLSVNRSLVEELLQTDTFLSGAGANVAEKAMDKLLGTAPQRPFDRGRMTVELAGDKITGLAVLESAKTRDYNGLNLRVTLDMDKSALAEAMKMLQENSATSVDF